MLLKDYLIIDNVLTNPKQAINLAKQSEFFCKTPFNDTNLKLANCGNRPLGDWAGCRSKPLHIIYPDFFQETFNHIFELFFPNRQFRYIIESFFHLIGDDVKNQSSPIQWWHKDHLDCFYAGVIFLNENPKQQSGTMLKLNDEEIIIENCFNRLALYKSDILHRPQDSSGSNLEDARLTLVFFVKELQLK